MNTLARADQISVLKALVEGNSMRATSRMTGVARETIADLLRDVGSHCKNHHDRFVRGLNTTRVQADEAWSFCGKKQRRVAKSEGGRVLATAGLGSPWTKMPSSLSRTASALVVARWRTHSCATWRNA